MAAELPGGPPPGEGGGDAGAGRAKVGFGFKQVKAAARPSAGGRAGADAPPPAAADVEYITSIQNGVLPASGKDAKVIPLQEDKWQPYRKLTSGLPNEQEDGDQFEQVAVEEKDANIKYGLTVMRKRKAVAADMMEVDRERPRTRMDELAVLREDLISLPPQADVDAYDAMPVEAFGEAMLRGMGWEKGKPVGRNSKAVVDPIEYVPREGRLGLGATPKPPEQREKKYIKPGETRTPQQPKMVMPEGPDGRVRHTKTLDEKLVERKKEGVHVGKVMLIMDGRHKGMRAKVLSIDMPPPDGRSQRATVQLVSSDEKIEVRVKELGEVSIGGMGNGKTAGSVQLLQDKKSKDRGQVAPMEDTLVQQPAMTAWLTPHVRVRIINKSLSRGKLYLKKGVIVDVQTPILCTVVLDDGRQVVPDVSQDMLETALPKPGGRVMAVGGSHRGRRGKLMQRDSANNRAVVQFADDFSMEHVAMDFVAEFVGEADEHE
eukprot:jgi/Chlat1/887/Chrsp107S01325